MIDRQADRFAWLEAEIAARPPADALRQELEIAWDGLLHRFDIEGELLDAVQAIAAGRQAAVGLGFRYWRQRHPSILGHLDACWAKAWERIRQGQAHGLGWEDRGRDDPPLAAEDFMGDRQLGEDLPSAAALGATAWGLVMLHHPVIYRAYGHPERWPVPFAQRGGFECGIGWAPIVARLSARLEAVAERCKAVGAGDEAIPLVVQVNEKFGRLCFHVQRPPELQAAFAEPLRQAEVRSGVTCERCGAAGRLITTGRHRVRCAACEALADAGSSLGS